MLVTTYVVYTEYIDYRRQDTDTSGPTSGYSTLYLLTVSTTSTIICLIQRNIRLRGSYMRFIESVGDIYYNGRGVDVYQRKDGGITLVPTKLGCDFPRRYWVTLPSQTKWAQIYSQLKGNSEINTLINILNYVDNINEPH